MSTRSITDWVQTLDDIIPALQMGLVPDSAIGQVYHKFSESNQITTQASILSSCENQDPFNTAGSQLYISSSDAADTQQIYLEGVDQNFLMASELITLTGQTAKALTTNFRTIFRGWNNNGTVLAGDVYVGTEVTPTGGIPATDNQYAMIPSIYDDKQVNQILTSVFTVPDNYTGFITEWYTSAAKSKDIELTAYARLYQKIFKYEAHMSTFESSIQRELPFLKFPSKTDFKVEALTSSGSISASTSYTLILLHNNYINSAREVVWR